MSAALQTDSLPLSHLGSPHLVIGAHSSLVKLENSAVATGLEKVSFHSNLKERQCQSAQTTSQVHSSHTLVK